MKTIFDHIEYVKGKPHHIRKRVALATAALGSGLIAIVWLVGSLATNSFAIQGTSFAASMEQNTIVVAPSDVGNKDLAGVAAAAALQDSGSPARINIVDTSAAAASKQQSEQTTLPF
jgi:hypothetical protein